VLDVVAEALPITLLLNVLTIPIIYAVAITAGIRAARHRGKAFDVASGTILIGLWSMPTMWIGVMCIGFLANRDFVRMFPTGGLHDTLAATMPFLPAWGAGGWQRGWLLDVLWHLVLPIFCLTYGGFAFLSKLMRASVLENLSADFARTARAKGVSEHLVLYRHVLSNSVLPLITVAAGILPGLLGGSVVVESIFSINGMGRLMIEAINMRDRELVLAQTLVIGVVSLVSLLIADICYAVADPRVSYE
jgi:peptide/nickel transport system permease protein